MAGLRSDDEILKAFEGLDRAPGSKQKRREPTELATKRKKKALGESNGWDEKPVVKYFKGTDTDFFTIGSLAQALEKSVVTIRSWEKHGYIPTTPYRFKAKSLNGKKVNGNRAYTRKLVEIAIEEFATRGLLGSARVEWSLHHSLTDALVRRWTEALK